MAATATAMETVTLFWRHICRNEVTTASGSVRTLTRFRRCSGEKTLLGSMLSGIRSFRSPSASTTGATTGRILATGCVGLSAQCFRTSHSGERKAEGIMTLGLPPASACERAYTAKRCTSMSSVRKMSSRDLGCASGSGLGRCALRSAASMCVSKSCRRMFPLRWSSSECTKLKSSALLPSPEARGRKSLNRQRGPEARLKVDLSIAASKSSFQVPSKSPSTSSTSNARSTSSAMLRLLGTHIHLPSWPPCTKGPMSCVRSTCGSWAAARSMGCRTVAHCSASRKRCGSTAPSSSATKLWVVIMWPASVRLSISCSALPTSRGSKGSR
mmetsp:Transcript_149331/g.416222  ORF Transcript_149331/g.416222 Transcript_149331/m.416222 type:complete len:328 (+) Transcript_149331:418-1401(+)